MSESIEQNLLLGIVAFQNDFVSRETLAAAFAEWLLDRDRPFADALAARAALTSDELKAIADMAQLHVERRGGDTRASLAALHTIESLRGELTALGDAALEASLPLFKTSAADSFATIVSPSAGAGGGADSASTPARYVRLRPHAAGGLGEVFVARDRELRREVALKEIKPQYADHAQHRERFVMEAEVTGNLEHPGIVPVYGLGRYEDGRPYYAMRFIRGESMRKTIQRFHEGEAADRRGDSLPLRRLLRRFIDACNAIEYAHSRGVLHRDLKPDNVMIGDFGETLVVDWGLAKLIGAQESDPAPAEQRTLKLAFGENVTRTQLGRVLGTPQYMSPEQAVGWHDRLTPASDVFSLGGVLYVILTGRPPLAGDSVDEVLEQARKAEIVPVREVNRFIPRALAAVCEKALSKSPSDRYVSARKLADDLEAYLADEPVTAWREPVAVKASRWLRRHQGVAGGGLAAALVTVVSLTAGLLLLGAKNAEIEEQRRIAVAERDAADRNFSLARDAVRRFLVLMSEDPRLKAEGLEHFRRELLAEASGFYRGLAEGRVESPELKAEEARGRLLEGDIVLDLGSRQDALLRYQAARKGFAELAASNGESEEYRDGLAQSWLRIGTAEARLGESKKAKASLAQAMEAAGDKNRSSLAEISALGELAELEKRLGETDAAEADFQEAIRRIEAALNAGPPRLSWEAELARWRIDLADLQDRRGDAVEAEQTLALALARIAPLADAHPDHPAVQLALSDAHNTRGILLIHLGRQEAAREAFRAAEEAVAAIVERHPDVLEFQAHRGLVQNNLGNDLLARGDMKAAGRALRDVLSAADRRAKKHPDDVLIAWALVMAHNNMVRFHFYDGDISAAAAEGARATELAEDLCLRFPQFPRHWSALIAAQRNRSQALAAQGEAAAAIELLEVSLATAEDHHQPGDLAGALEAAAARQGLGMLLLNQGDEEPAARQFAAAAALLEDSQARRPVPLVQGQLADVHAAQGRLEDARGRAAEADRHFAAAEEIWKLLAVSLPDEPAYPQRLGDLYQLLRHRLGEAAGAETELLTKAVEAYRRAAPEQLDDGALRLLLIGQMQLGDRLWNEGDAAAAAAWYQRAIPPGLALWRRSLVPADGAFLCQAILSHGHQHEELGDWQQALAEYEQCAAVAAELIQQDPDLQNARYLLGQAHVDRGRIHLAAGRYPAAAGAFQRALLDVMPSQESYVLSRRGAALAGAGDHAAAAEEAAALVAEADGEERFLAAAVLSLAAQAASADRALTEEERTGLAAGLVERALDQLRAAAAAGFFASAENRAMLAADADLEFLRGQQAYQDWAADL